MNEIIRFALLGLGAGGVYLFAGQGLLLVYRGSGIINFAQGAMGMVGAFTFYELRELHGLPTALAFAVAVAATAVLGVLVHFGVMRPLRHAPAVARLLGPLAVLAVLLAVANIRYGNDFLPFPPVLPTDTVEPFADTALGLDRIVIFALGLALTGALALHLRLSKFGLATQAVAENQQTAASYGVSPEFVAGLNWAIAGALAAVAAILTASLSGVLSASALVLLVLPGLAAALVGGFRSFILTAAGAIAIGIAESEMARYVTTPGASKSVPFLIIVAALILRGRALPLRDEVVLRAPLLGSGRFRPGVVGPAVAAALALAWFASEDWVSALTTTCIVGLIVLSLVVVTGLAGQVSLAQYALAGIGAWIAARGVANFGWSFPVAALIGIAGAIPVGVLVGIPAVRARGVNLAVATLGLALVLEQLIFGNTARTGGSLGTNVGIPSIAGIEFDNVANPERYATLTVVVLLVAMLAVANLRRGRAGRRLIAVRANERAAASLGISLFGAKLYAFALGSAIAATGGILLAFRNPFVGFTPFTILNSINVTLFAVIGGIGYVAGALIGAMLAPGSLSQRLLDSLFSAEGTTVHVLALLGSVGALVTLLQHPNGAASVFQSRWGRRPPKPFADAVDRPGEEYLPVEPASDNGTQPLSDQSTGPPARRLEGRNRDKPEPATLEVDGVSVRFGGVTALADVSLTVRPGQVVGLIGPNGAGKTTLIDAVTGFVTSTGAIRVNGRPIEGLNAVRRARLGIARSFQSLELFDSLTIAENLQVAADRRDSLAYLTDLVRPGRAMLPPAALAAVDEFELSPYLDRRPEELPFGLRRLAAIARSIAGNPSILLLDEPAAGLSRSESQELGALVRGLAERWGIAVLLVEHDVGLVLETCDEIYVLAQGRLLAQGTPVEIRADQRVIDAYLGDQDAGAPTIDDGDAQVDAASNGREASDDANGDETDVTIHPGTEDGLGGPPPTGARVLEVQGLSAGYGALAAARDLNIEVRKGEIVALLGPNGAGKTTTLLTIAGALPALAGTVMWQEREASGPLHRRVRAGLGLLTDDRCILRQLTAAGNLRLAGCDVDAALDIFPELADLLGRRAGLLSGGEQQILSLARVLTTRPSLLLVDEMSLGLAPLVVARLYAALRRAADDGLGVLLVEQHVHRALSVADRVYVMNHGSIVLEGTAAELRERESDLQASYLAAL
jgi:ABC-type branched-subunit amino acid transport system ATPase component/branched-subunit amino acid ABC-type transport system permease component